MSVSSEASLSVSSSSFDVLQVVPEEEVNESGEEKQVDRKDHLFVLRFPKESLRRGRSQQEKDVLLAVQCTTIY